ncbi:MAG: hypothetical protein C5B51_02935 [Terriglobia bacterium]|nr:MAG: hypothetical protein C5B51_02935 [Terriglobia bacterium]
MYTLKHLTVALVAVIALLFGSVREVQAGVIEAKKHAQSCRDLPVIKNLTALKAQHVCEGTTPKELTSREVKKLAVTANTREDHLVVARFYRADANGLDTKAAGYERAATNLRNTPVAKNLAAPGTAARFEFAAVGFREEANAGRAIAATHEKMAADVLALLK